MKIGFFIVSAIFLHTSCVGCEGANSGSNEDPAPDETPAEELPKETEGTFTEKSTSSEATPTQLVPTGSVSCGDLSFSLAPQRDINSGICNGATIPNGQSITFFLSSPNCGLTIDTTNGAVSGKMPYSDCSTKIGVKNGDGEEILNKLQVTLSVKNQKLIEFSGAYDSSTLNFALDDTRGVGYFGLADALYRVQQKSNELTAISNTNSSGADAIGKMTLDKSRDMLYFIADTGGGNLKLFRAKSDSTTLAASDAISNTNPAGSDNPAGGGSTKRWVYDDINGSLYINARDASSYQVYKVTASHTSNTKLLSTDALSNMAASIGDQSSPGYYVVDRSKNTLYFNGRRASGSYKLYKLDATTTSAAPIETTEYISNTRDPSHTNDYPKSFYFMDEENESAYYSSSNSSGQNKIYRYSSATTAASPSASGDHVTNTYSGNSDSCMLLAKDTANDSNYFSCKITGGFNKVFRLTSAQTSSNKLVEAAALTNTNPGASDEAVSGIVDSQRKLLYFVAQTASGGKLFRLSHDDNTTKTASSALSDINPGGDDNVGSLIYNSSTGFLYFTATNSSSKTQLYRLSHDQINKVLESDVISSTHPSNADNPGNLFLDSNENRIYFTADTSDTTTKLFSVFLGDPTALPIAAGKGHSLPSGYSSPTILGVDGNEGTIYLSIVNEASQKRIFSFGY